MKQTTKIIYILMILVIISFGTIASIPASYNINKLNRGNIEWSYTYGSDLIDWGNCIYQTSDGGYIISGTYFRNAWSLWYSYVYLLKLDSNGNQEWYQQHGSYDQEFVGKCVRQTSDGGYIIGGYKGVTYRYDAYVEKTDSVGNVIWTNSFGLPDKFDEGHSIRSTLDGYILTGFTQSYGRGSCDVWLIKLDTDGYELWNTTFGGLDADYGYDVELTSDGGYIIVGSTESYGTNYTTDVWLIKTDVNGNELWNITFGGSEYEEGYCVQQTSDGGFIITGCTSSTGAGNNDVWLIKTDVYGNLEWEHTYGGIDDDEGYSLQQTKDGGFFITGFYGRGESQSDLYVIKTDSKGKIEWKEIIDNDSAEDVGYYGIQVSDGSYIVTGYTGNYIEETIDAWVIKFMGGSTTTFYIEMSGGLGVSATITNTGTSDAIDVPWEVHIYGGIFGRINKTVSGTVDILVGQSKTLSTGPVFGFGLFNIQVKVVDTIKKAEGTQVLILSFLK
ncbi:MAG: hypothetical protein JXA91_01300 [Candidatus Thermoplasmatota archaeon]|nr:hypothetical protein [Candidatus Thermoplasmatota archaeon]